MIYIAESGSTKCDGVFLRSDGEEVARISTEGLNPYFHSSEFIHQQLKGIAEIGQYGPEVSAVYFFGAGCSTPALQQKVADGLSPHFPNASIKVEHDLMACAYATYNGSPGISCILGTGSNAVYFDGESITKGISGAGYILGDEGSASYIGKKVLTAYLYHTMPHAARHDFEKIYNLSAEDIKERVYRKPQANVFIADFATFAHRHIHTPFFEEIVFDGFYSFLDVQVRYFKNAPQVPIHFVGSVAHFFKPILEKAINSAGLEMGTVLRRPIDGLLHYFKNFVLNP